MEWLLTVKSVFDLKDYVEEKKVKLVAIKLKGYASLWWENFKWDRECMGKTRIRSWSKMKRELHKRFIQDNYQQEVYLKYFSFKQCNLSMVDDTREFEFLMLMSDIKELEPQTIAHYIGELKENIADVIRLQPY